MFIFFLKRIIGMIPILFIVSILVFLFVRALPGDPAMISAGNDASELVVEMIRKEMGLDKPIWKQFIIYLKNLLMGDLGYSIRTQQPVIDEISRRFFPTFSLTIFSMIWAIVFGLFFGILAAIYQNSILDRLIMCLTISAFSIPSFALGMILIQIFSINLGWFPSIGHHSWKNFVLPSITLGMGISAIIVRFTRSSMLDVMKEKYVMTAKAKGASSVSIIFKHVLKNAMVPLITMIGLQFGFLLGGSIVVEYVFNFYGLGSLLIESVERRDYPLIQGLILLFSFQFLVINLFVDLLYGVFNPTIRYK